MHWLVIEIDRTMFADRLVQALKGLIFETIQAWGVAGLWL
jgi:hypothetical protein